jgi:hypothetical protein
LASGLNLDHLKHEIEQAGISVAKKSKQTPRKEEFFKKIENDATTFEINYNAPAYRKPVPDFVSFLIVII